MVLATGEQIYRRKFDPQGARGALNDMAKANGYLVDDPGKVAGLQVIINVGAMNGEKQSAPIEVEVEHD